MPLTELDKLEEWAVNLINDYESLKIVELHYLIIKFN
mgnify:CR=1 FL=1